MSLLKPELLLRRVLVAVGVLALCAAARAAFDAPATANDPASFDGHNVKIEAVDYLNRKALRVTTVPPDKDGAGFALLRGSDFQDGAIDVDLAVKITTPPGFRMPGFIGLAFRMSADTATFEDVYLRPKNSLSDDQAMRNHAVQYCAEPDYGWYRLRREWPFVYESWADIAPETWIHLRIEVAGRAARVFLNGSSRPSLVVDGLKGPNLHGGVALWAYAGEESYFSNLRITPSPPLPIKNGSDAAGSWAVRFFTDAGRFQGIMKLTRDGDKLTGTWSGGLGDNRPVTGTWRDGHVDLKFDGEWPNDGRDGAPGPVTALMEGWIDDAAAKGRMRVPGRTDGRWEAQRQSEQSSR
jgi:hypothetical protein